MDFYKEFHKNDEKEGEMYAELLISIGVPEIVLGAIVEFGSVALATKTVELAAKGEHEFFLSGGDDAMNAAMNYAKANGMTTLEMTRAGQNLTKLTQGMPWEQAGPMWQRLSAAYAKGANGSVHVFQNANTGVRLNSFWRTVEYPLLNGKII